MSVNESSDKQVGNTVRMERVVRPIALVTSSFLAYVLWADGSLWLAVSFTLFAAYNLYGVVKDLGALRRRAR